MSHKDPTVSANYECLEAGMGTPPDKYELPTDIKVCFIKKIFILLSIQLCITWLMSYIIYANQNLHKFVLQSSGMLIVTTLGACLTLCLSICYGKLYPFNYIILFSFTLCESYSVSYICLYYNPTSILLAWGLTATIFIVLSSYVMYTGKDFSFMGAGLFACLWILIIGGFIQIIWLPHDQILNTTMAAFGAMVASGYILYDTSEIIHRLDPDEFVHACMSLYLDIIMLFIRLLELFGDKNN